MGMSISFNLSAMNTTRHINANYADIAKSIEKIASGQEINSAADDPAGLAVANQMRASVAATNQGIRNANMAASLTQTADGAMSTIQEQLTRMNELATQAATGTISEVQRSIINEEYQQLASEITRIASSTEFNGTKLLDGSLSSGVYDGSGLNSTGSLLIHFGDNNNSDEDYYTIQISGLTAGSLGVGNEAEQDVLTQQSAQEALSAISSAMQTVNANRANIGAIQNRLDATISNGEIETENAWASISAIKDLDMANGVTSFVQNQLLLNASTSMLTQANVLSQRAVGLLGNF